MREHELFGMLKKKFPSPQWCLLPQVRSAAGFDATRTADAIAMNLWPSRGLEVHGFELKVDRRDWLRELNDPAKSAKIQANCDHWWIVVSDAAIVVDGELPKTWGLIAPRGKGLTVVHQAPLLKAKPIGRSFVAAMLKRAMDIHDSGTLRREYHRGLDEGKASVIDQGEAVRDKLAERNAIITRFEQASGQSLRFGDPEAIGKAVREVLEGDRSLDRTRDGLRGLLHQVDRVRESLVRELELEGVG